MLCMQRLPSWTFPLVFLFLAACGSDAPAPGITFPDVGGPLPGDDTSDVISETVKLPGADTPILEDCAGFDTPPRTDTEEDDGPAPPLDSDDDGTPDDDDCAPLDPEIHPGADEVCNGVDDDCDDEIDEDLGDLTCGLGACQTTVPACAFGVPVTCAPLDVATDEVCDGVDNDCDGDIDDGFEVVTCGLGACTNTISFCIEGLIQTCEPLDIATDEVCDGVDNDCDGDVDEDLPEITCGLGPCETIVPGCVDGGIPECVPLDVATDEVCDGVDNDCDGDVDEDLGETTCGSGACQVTVTNCVDGIQQECVPLPVPAGTCDAPSAPCLTTTNGLDACGNPCTKVGPPHCFIVHPACLTSNPGTYTDTTHCTTPKGSYDCGLTCEQWPNNIGADCVYCVNIFCQQQGGKDKAQFYCANYPAPPTP